ncbi:hypothetical protein SpCBS45565_g06306 [Spizellomyces sp. 'palustris']|nr:hypothetical protein SpCBS45565_g06306 [Spizellomyces sp. 'palustris']
MSSQSAPIMDERDRQLSAGHIFENADSNSAQSSVPTTTSASTTASSTYQSAKDTATHAYQSAKDMANSAYQSVKDAVAGNNEADPDDEIGVL